jgi:hypothetical protein
LDNSGDHRDGLVIRGGASDAVEDCSLNGDSRWLPSGMDVGRAKIPAPMDKHIRLRMHDATTPRDRDVHHPRRLVPLVGEPHSGFVTGGCAVPAGGQSSEDALFV